MVCTLCAASSGWPQVCDETVKGASCNHDVKMWPLGLWIFNWRLHRGSTHFPENTRDFSSTAMHASISDELVEVPIPRACQFYQGHCAKALPIQRTNRTGKHEITVSEALQRIRVRVEGDTALFPQPASRQTDQVSVSSPGWLTPFGVQQFDLSGPSDASSSLSSLTPSEMSAFHLAISASTRTP